MSAEKQKHKQQATLFGDFVRMETQLEIAVRAADVANARNMELHGFCLVLTAGEANYRARYEMASLQIQELRQQIAYLQSLVDRFMPAPPPQSQPTLAEMPCLFSEPSSDNFTL